MLNIEDYRDHYNNYFNEFNRLAVGEYADLSYGNDKPNPTASSLESIIAYAQYVIDRGIAPILNAGSGASSWMLRKLFPGFVIDVDPNKLYIEFVQFICSKNEIDSKNFQEGFIHNGIYHTFYDYGDIERLPYLGAAIDITRKSIYIDDTDARDECMPYRKHVIALAESMKLRWFDCKESLDQHGRAGIIIEK